MKYLNFSKQFLPILGAIVLFSSCKKVENFEPMGDSGQKYIKIVDYGGMRATTGFANSALVLDLSLPNEIVPVQLELTTSQVYDQDITVTIGYSAAKLAAYNAAQPAGGIIFQPLTAAQYSLSTTTVKIKAGQTMSEPFNIIFHPNTMNIALSYMLPIEIVSITGGNGEVIVAPGTGTAYFHIIGNPLAGNYTDIGIRYNYTGSVAWSGPPAVLALSTAPDVPSMGNPPGGTVQTTYNQTNQALPVDAQTVYMGFGNVPNPGSTALATYFITGNATFSAITYDHGSTFNSGYSGINKYIRSYTAPSPTQKASYRLITHYNNAVAGAGGSDRIVDESFRQQ